MTLRKEIEASIEPFIECSQDDCEGCACEVGMLTNQICSLIKERLEKIIHLTRLNDCTCYTPIKNLTEELE